MKDDESTGKEEDAAVSLEMHAESDTEIRPYVPFREKLCTILHSHKFQIGIVVLVIIDCLLVIVELFLEFEKDAKKNTAGEESLTVTVHVIHNIGIFVLSIFLVEIFVKIYAFRLEFFKHKLEIFDAVIVISAFVLDIIFIPKQSSQGHGEEATGLLIILRLWRIGRILNGIVQAVKTQAENRLAHERNLKEEVTQDLMKCRDYCSVLEEEIDILRSLIQKHGISDVPPTMINREL